MEFVYWVDRIAIFMKSGDIAPDFAEKTVESFMGVPEMYREKLPEAVAHRVEEMRKRDNY